MPQKKKKAPKFPAKSAHQKKQPNKKKKKASKKDCDSSSLSSNLDSDFFNAAEDYKKLESEILKMLNTPNMHCKIVADKAQNFSKQKQHQWHEQDQSKTPPTTTAAAAAAAAIIVEPLAIHIIDTLELCESAIAQLSKKKYIGFDCEGYPSLSRHCKVSLIQLSTQTDSYLFDLIAFDHVIPKCLKDFLEMKPDPVSGPFKMIHDSRSDQDALCHVYNVKLSGIFDTTVANMVRRVCTFKHFVTHLQSQDSLASRTLDYDTFRKVTVTFPHFIQSQSQQQSLNSNSKKKEKKKEKKTIENKEEEEEKEKEEKEEKVDVEKIKKKRKKTIVNIFEGKNTMKTLMQKDDCLWKRRPMDKNMILYAGIDAFVSLQIGLHFVSRMPTKIRMVTLNMSKKWCFSIAKKERLKKGDSRVPKTFVKQIQLNYFKVTSE